MADAVKVEHISVDSDYPSLDELICINRFNSTNSRIKKAKVETVECGHLAGEIELVCFDQRLETKDANRSLLKRNQRPLTFQEGLLLAFLQPDIQRHMTIVLTGTIIQCVERKLWIPCLNGSVNERELNLGSYCDDLIRFGPCGWPKHCYFAAIKDTD